jgi:hypothetical protein
MQLWTEVRRRVAARIEAILAVNSRPHDPQQAGNSRSAFYGFQKEA